MKKMALLFLIIGIASLLASSYFYFKKEPAQLSVENGSKQKGNDFEDYMIQNLGKQANVTLIGKVSDYHKNGISAQENKEPDLKFKFHSKPFAVECKWRKSFSNGKINWAKEYQIKNYQTYQTIKGEKVFVAIGIGGEPKSPEKLYFVPLYRLTREFANEDYIREFEIIDPSKIPEILKREVR